MCVISDVIKNPTEENKNRYKKFLFETGDGLKDMGIISKAEYDSFYCEPSLSVMLENDLCGHALFVVRTIKKFEEYKAGLKEISKAQGII